MKKHTIKVYSGGVIVDERTITGKLEIHMEYCYKVITNNKDEFRFPISRTVIESLNPDSEKDL